MTRGGTNGSSQKVAHAAPQASTCDGGISGRGCRDFHILHRWKVGVVCQRGHCGNLPPGPAARLRLPSMSGSHLLLHAGSSSPCPTWHNGIIRSLESHDRVLANHQILARPSPTKREVAKRLL